MKWRAAVGASAALALFVVGLDAEAADRKVCLDSANRGQTFRDHGDLVAAKKEFVICADSSCPSPLPKYCGDWLTDVNSKIGGIIVKLVDSTGKDVTRTSRATVMLDDASLASSAVGNRIDVNPGPHKVTVESPNGGPRMVEDANVNPGEKDHVVVVVVSEKPAPVTPPPPLATTKPTPDEQSPKPKSGLAAVPMGSWIGWGVGAVGLIGFGIFGISALSDYNRYESQCGNNCSNDARDDVEQSMIFADVLLGVGLVGAVVGTVLYFTRSEPKTSTSTSTAWRPMLTF